MKKITSLLITSVFLSLFSTVAFSDENVKKLSNFQATGTEPGIVIPQDTKFAENIKKNISYINFSFICVSIFCRN